MRSCVLTAGKIWPISIWKITTRPKKETAGFVETLVTMQNEHCIVNLEFFEQLISCPNEITKFYECALNSLISYRSHVDL